MRKIQVTQLRARLAEIFDVVRRGEAMIITRYGRVVARLMPQSRRRLNEIDKAIQSINALGRRNGKITVKELLSASHAGHTFK